jgi:type IV pilus assembly protein PilW
MQGLTLVELMVAMVLGLVVIGGAVSLTLANRQSYRTNEGLSQLQESARSAFELISRDLRQAGVTGCDNQGRIANVLDTSGGTEWWMEWFGILGHDDGDDTSAATWGTVRGERAAGTDALQLQGIQGIAQSLDLHEPVGATMEINAAATDIAAGDVLIACDFDHAAIFQVSAYDSGDVELTHDTGTVSPGNCSRGLGFPTDCSTVTGNAYEFDRNALLGRFFATDWYIGQTERADEGGRALFRRRLGPGGTVLTEEIVAGVTDMQIWYRLVETDDFVAASALNPADWEDVNAVRIELTTESADTRVSTDNTVNSGRLSRNFAQIVTLRNRVP